MAGTFEGFPLFLYQRCQLRIGLGTEIFDDDRFFDVLQVVKRYVLAKLFAGVSDSRR